MAAVSRVMIAQALLSRLSPQERVAFATVLLLDIRNAAACGQLVLHSDTIRDHALVLSAGAHASEVG